MGKTSAKVGKPAAPATTAKFALDTGSAKRGRKPKIPASWVRGRADNYRWILEQLWDRVWPRISKAETTEDVVTSFSSEKIGAYALEFVPLAGLILKVVRDRHFPKHKQQAQIIFLADSIAGHGLFTPRSSRDICERERARAKRSGRILRYEFYIECSCGYQGPSRKHACPECGAAIPFEADPRLGFPL